MLLRPAPKSNVDRTAGEQIKDTDPGVEGRAAWIRVQALCQTLIGFGHQSRHGGRSRLTLPQKNVLFLGGCPWKYESC